MAKPLNQFGGWLRFLQVMSILGIVIGTIATVFVSYVIFEKYASGEFIQDELKASLLFILVEFPVSFYFVFKILMNLNKKSPESPDIISRYIRYNLIFIVLISIVELFVYISIGDASSSIYETLKSLIGTAVGASIWLSYFKQSIRVKEFYGKNAGMENPVFPAEEELTGDHEQKKEINKTADNMEIRYSKVFISLWGFICGTNVLLAVITGSLQTIIFAILTGIITVSVMNKPVATIRKNIITMKALIGPVKKSVMYDTLEFTNGKLFAVLGGVKKKVTISALVRRKEDWERFLKDYVQVG